ncbi:MAG: hypothetical protein ACE5I5_09130 [Candidatus Heimdallarchaeota archaeon]
MIKLKEPKTLAIVFFPSGIYDTIGGFLFAFMVGTDRSIDNPPTHPFYAIFIASFLFCFAYLQLLSAFNIRRYVLIIGGVLIGRIFYAVLLFAYMFFVPDFPSTFWFTGIIDVVWSILYIVLILINDEIRLRDLFLPYRGVS